MGVIENIEAKFCVQTAVYWGNPEPDGYGGFTYDVPVEIDVRWDPKTEMKKGMDRDGTVKEIVTKAEILCTQDLDVGGMIQLAAIGDIDSDLLPNVGEAWEILIFEKIPMVFKTDDFVRTAYI